MFREVVTILPGTLVGSIRHVRVHRRSGARHTCRGLFKTNYQTCSQTDLQVIPRLRVLQ